MTPNPELALRTRRAGNQDTLGLHHGWIGEPGGGWREHRSPKEEVLDSATRSRRAGDCWDGRAGGRSACRKASYIPAHRRRHAGGSRA